jgi:hypothetical protein
MPPLASRTQCSAAKAGLPADEVPLAQPAVANTIAAVITTPTSIARTSH